MTGVRGAGALIALKELGFHFAFEEIYVISAGLPNASYFLAGQNLGPSIYYEDCAGRRFINALRLWKIVDIDYLIHVFRIVKPLDVDSVLTHPTKLHIRLRDSNSKSIYLEIHNVPKNEYFGLMKAALSLPCLHPGSTQVGNGKYKDPGFRENELVDHIRYVLDSDATDIIIIYNHLGQVRSVRKTLKLPSAKVLEIMPKLEWRLSRFETNAEKVKEAAIQIGNLTKQVFGSKEGVSLDIKHDKRG